jgi:hypothetical protein
LGSKVRSSSYEADTFCIGLSYLHLLTGHAPYEELMSDVRCPDVMRHQLALLWETSDESDPYHVISQVNKSLQFDGSSVPCDDVQNVLYDTLYRYVVLLGLPSPNLFSSNESGDKTDAARTQDGYIGRNEVVAAILDTLGTSTQFGRDAKLWNIFSGNHELMLR